MNCAKVVIGSAYGDEGKGAFTDYLSAQENESMVIRFNGGAQAGHTVTTPDGRRHVFGHFASNSFLPNAKTILSRFFVVNPLLFKKEKQALSIFKLYPEVFIDENSYITTPYEMILNQWMEDSRGDSRHGSCGVGFGETVEREEVAKISLRMKDIGSSNFKVKLLEVKDGFLKRVDALNLNGFLEKNLFVKEDFFIEKFKEDSIESLKNVKIFNKKFPNSSNIIFEGAQGLLLDQSFGYFPHVTRSNTGLKNVAELAKENNINNLDVVYASRCYTTRHGAGPINNKLIGKPYPGIIDKTNIPNNYQGSLMFAHLDLTLLKETIKKDLSSVINNDLNITYKLGISCLDQAETIMFYQDNFLKSIRSIEFAEYLKIFFKTDVIENWGGVRDKIF